MIKHKDFDKYSDYVEVQKRRANRTTKNTKHRLGEFQKIAKSLRERFPDYESILCVGCRLNCEIAAFKQVGFKAVGIDLIEKEGVIQCDMFKIPEHDFFQNKKIDIMFCSHSLEHCLDFDGFIKGVAHLDTKVIMVLCPLRAGYSEWDCTVYDFMKPSGKITEEDILKYFKGFKLLNVSINTHRRKNMGSITFLLERGKT